MTFKNTQPHESSSGHEFSHVTILVWMGILPRRIVRVIRRSLGIEPGGLRACSRSALAPVSP